MAVRNPTTTSNYPEARQLSPNPTEIEIDKQRNLCRVERKNGIYGGYKKSILTENLTERDNALLVCEICEGILRDACISSSGAGQFCSCCEVVLQEPKSSTINKSLWKSRARTPSKQTPNVAVRKMVSSLKSCCPLLERGCEWMGSLKDCEDHLDTCGYVGDKCNICGTVLQRNELKIHEEEKCSQRIVKCKHCNKELIFSELTVHTEKCPKMQVSCELKCGKIMCREDMAHHLDQECGLVEEICGLGCGAKLTRDELKIHVTDICIQREIPCEHCKEDFKFCEIITHFDECPKIKVSCDLKCGVVLCREDMAHHLEQECGLVEETCGLGCGAKLTRDELKIHVTDICIQREIPCEHCGELIEFCNMSTHCEECPKTNVSCELKCGVIMCREDVTQHFKEYCPEKEIACPFANYSCEVVMKRKSMEKHLEEERTEHTELKLNVLENLVAMLSEQINTLCSIYNTTKLDWNIEDITEFVQIVHPPIRKEVAGLSLTIIFNKQFIHVSFENKQGIYKTTVIAKFIISLYSKIKMRALKQYKLDISGFQTDVEHEIAHIPYSDIQEFSHIGATENIILEMYITII